MFALDAYAARSCPLKTAHAFSGVEAPPSQATPLVGAQDFLDQIVRTILAGQASTRDLRGLTDAPSEDQQAACLAAMADGVAVIIGGLLPRDAEHHRRGRADLLVSDGEGGYLPGIIRFHRTLDLRRDERPFSFSELDDLTVPVSRTGWRYRWNWRWTNAVFLAHLWELLGPTGFQSQRPEGLVIGTDDLPDHGAVAVRVDLAESAVAAVPGEVAEDLHVSALQRYHREFALRVELATAAAAGSPPSEPYRVPVVSRECGSCRWWPRCQELLDPDDLSLRINKAPLDRYEITALRSLGVSTLTQLAQAPIEALLADYLPSVEHRPDAEDRLRLAYRRSRLLSRGLELERLTSGPIELPPAELEIDIDVETSRTDRVYLWGFWIGTGADAHYHQFSSFTDLDAAGELALAEAAMAWLKQTVAGRDARVYHYSDYELVRLHRLADSTTPLMTWAEQYAESAFVDLFTVVRRNFFGANGLGLKVVAHAGAGFEWRDEDPGGLNSMGWFETALTADSAVEREAARERILRYNEDDVRATAALRQWLRSLV